MEAEEQAKSVASKVENSERTLAATLNTKDIMLQALFDDLLVQANVYRGMRQYCVGCRIKCIIHNCLNSKSKDQKGKESKWEKQLSILMPFVGEVNTPGRSVGLLVSIHRG